jgi:hypothetical protein
MNGSWDIQRALVESHQAELRHEADTTRIAADAAFAASAERTRHAAESDTTGHRVTAPRAAAVSPTVKPAPQSTAVAPTRTTCDGSMACSERTLAA